MTFLYLPTSFENIIDEAIRETNKRERVAEKRKVLYLESPTFEDGDPKIMRVCTFAHPGEMSEERNKWDNVFAHYFRHFDDIIIGVRDDEDKPRLPDVLITQLVSNPNLTTAETFDIGDSIVRLDVDKGQFYIEMAEPRSPYNPLPIPDEIYKASWNHDERNTRPFEGNEEYVKSVVREILGVAAEYALGTGETYIEAVDDDSPE